MAQQEIDLIEVDNGAMKAFEIKWSGSRKVHFPLSFTKSYPEATALAVNPQNYLELLLE